MICQCFIHGSSLTQKKEILRPIMLMPILYKADTFQLSSEHVPRNLSRHTSYQGFWKRLKCPVYTGKNGLFLVSGKRKISCFAKSPGKDLPRVCSRPPASITAFSKKVTRGRKVPWGYVAKRWQKRPGKYKEKKYRNRTQPVFQESLHQWRRKKWPCTFERDKRDFSEVLIRKDTNLNAEMN